MVTTIDIISLFKCVESFLESRKIKTINKIPSMLLMIFRSDSKLSLFKAKPNKGRVNNEIHNINEIFERSSLFIKAYPRKTPKSKGRMVNTSYEPVNANKKLTIVDAIKIIAFFRLLI